MIVCTIGFSNKNLREFIGRLKDAGVKKVVDVRLNNTSQLAGYAKKQDLQFVLELTGIDYEHVLELAPTDELMKGFKEKKIAWDKFKDIYYKLLEDRNPLNSFDISSQPDTICLLCAEDKPATCHRTLAANYIKANNEGVEIKHL